MTWKIGTTGKTCDEKDRNRVERSGYEMDQIGWELNGLGTDRCGKGGDRRGVELAGKAIGREQTGQAIDEIGTALDLLSVEPERNGGDVIGREWQSNSPDRNCHEREWIGAVKESRGADLQRLRNESLRIGIDMSGKRVEFNSNGNDFLRKGAAKK